MTDREKQVEEMQDILINNGVFNNLICRQDYAYPDALISDMCRETAEIVFNNGYRKMDEITLKLDLGDRSSEEIQQIAEMFNGEIRKQVAKDILQTLHYEIDREKGAGTIYGDFNYGLDTALNKVENIAEDYGVEIDK